MSSTDLGPHLLPFVPRDWEVMSWGIGDGAAGHRSQILGLCEALGGFHEQFESRVRLPWKLLPVNWLPTSSRILQQDRRFPVRPKPKALISCGRSAAMASVLVRRTFTPQPISIHLQNPGTDLNEFDLVVTPEHDRILGPNVIHTLGALHPLSPRKLELLRQEDSPAGLCELKSPFAGVLLGGPNKYYPFSRDDVAGLIAGLRVAESSGIKLAILPSRRTPDHAVDALRRTFGNRHFVWTGETENPYQHVLAKASHFIVTCDSVSMISEATATGRPVHLEMLAAKRRPKKFERFHESFSKRGMVRQFLGTLPEWSYEPHFEADRVAEIVMDRLEDPARRHAG
ncbi:MAG: mitochondrial fission ELM1 family protein [Planctomycetaceae bacterium]|nr:mitochondrial fission ELM1 family protein [Planctomycetaceae bacterium]